ncbi:hypothetical protein XCR1_1430041 [Xenorhabdus cabanillasii JM26]|uniref:Uncharacterized protein n=1 Tax=Xenorhabdus cabanillasii JM26 TaxID=1427517 RepID=W1IPA7_9GAMM|nr:hypothetical protein XCR1_1430041 [Xenorhabdus cabanillasii JM26]
MGTFLGIIPDILLIALLINLSSSFPLNNAILLTIHLPESII